MAHAIVEYSANLEADVDIGVLLAEVHRAALASGVFPTGGLRTRAARRERYVIADAHPDNAFVHLLLRVGHGRDTETLQRAGEQIFAAACACLQTAFDSRPLAVSCDIQEIDHRLTFKHNNLHTYVAERRARSGGAT